MIKYRLSGNMKNGAGAPVDLIRVITRSDQTALQTKEVALSTACTFSLSRPVELSQLPKMLSAYVPPKSLLV